MLSDYSDNEVVAGYIEYLEKLREVFMAINIDMPVNFDSNSDKAKKQIDKWLVEIEKLQSEVAIIRKEITE
jgi:hypothetical protein